MYVHKILYVFLLLICSQCVGSCKLVHPHLVLLGRLHLQIQSNKERNGVTADFFSNAAHDSVILFTVFWQLVVWSAI